MVVIKRTGAGGIRNKERNEAKEIEKQRKKLLFALSRFVSNIQCYKDFIAKTADFTNI